MDLDLTEYDQVIISDEIKLMMENQAQMYCDGSSKFLVTLSSCSDQASVEEANCENDYVFLPPPPNSNYSNQYSAPTTSRSQSQQLQPKPESKLQSKANDSTTVFNNVQQAPFQPLNTITNNGVNPFEFRQSISVQTDGLAVQKQPTSIMRQIESCFSKPIGLLEANQTASSSATNKLTELMTQIVTRSDSIYIAVPCAYCHEPVTCPPSDISSWLDHMNQQHNCKVCPVCNKLVGLGPLRDLEIMKNHVIDHLDEDFLEKRSARVSFTYGLQQHWFSSTRCGIKDSRHK